MVSRGAMDLTPCDLRQFLIISLVSKVVSVFLRRVDQAVVWSG